MICYKHGVELADTIRTKRCLLCHFVGTDLTRQLPFEADLLGWRLKFIHPREDDDPFYLLHPDGHVVYTWYTEPSLTEVSERWQELRNTPPLHLENIGKL